MKTVDRILEGLAKFQKNVYPKHRDLFEQLAKSQQPNALFLACSDSRIDPSLLMQTKPGELFICRNIGNIVPKYPYAIGGEYGPAQTAGAGNGPSAIATGDFNADGIADLVTANFNGNSVSVLIGKGNGTFRQPKTARGVLGPSFVPASRPR